YELVDPTGAVVATTSTPQTVNGVASGDAELTTANPMAGTWQIDVILRLTVSGNEFTQTVDGNGSPCPARTVPGCEAPGLGPPGPWGPPAEPRSHGRGRAGWRR